MAASSSLSESDVRKIVRYAITQRIFEEPRPGVITHSAVSRLLAEDSGVHDHVTTCSDDLWQAAAQTCNAMMKFHDSEEPTETVRNESLTFALGGFRFDFALQTFVTWRDWDIGKKG